MRATLILVAMCFLSACATYPNEWRAAEKACEPHGGIKFYRADIGSFGLAKCQDGAVVTDVVVERATESKGGLQ